MRKGERSTQVVYYVTAVKDAKPEDGGDGKKPFRFIRTFNVFNAEQIDGLPEHYHARQPTAAPVAERMPEMEAFVRLTGADIRYGGGRAFYRIGLDYIQMPEFGAFRDAEQFYSTLCHELVHLSRQADKQILVQHLLAQRPVESFDVGILVGLAWLDVLDRHAVNLGPLGKGLAQEFRAIAVRKTCGRPRSCGRRSKSRIKRSEVIEVSIST